VRTSVNDPKRISTLLVIIVDSATGSAFSSSTARQQLSTRFFSQFVRNPQYLHDQVDSLLDSKSIRGRGKCADGESELCMALHGERCGKPKPLLNEVLQFSLGDFGLTGVCQFNLLPKLQTLRWWLPQDVARSRRQTTI
jgi:hypothetical protein